MDLWSKFELAKNFVGSFSGLFLPVLVILLFFILTRALPMLFKRSRGGAVGRRNVSLEDEVSEFQEAVGIAEKELGPSGVSEGHPMSSITDRDDSSDEIVRTAELDPEMGIIRLSGALEKEAGRLAASLARQHGKRISNVGGPLRLMVKKKHLPGAVSRPMELFSRLSDRIVRGKVPEDSPVVHQTLAAGLVLLNTIKRTHGVIQTVEYTGVDVFTDEACEHVMQHVKGVIIKTINSKIENIGKGIYPTANPTYYHWCPVITN